MNQTSQWYKLQYPECFVNEELRMMQNTRAGDDYPSAGAGGNRPGIPACRPGSGLSKSDYRAAEVDSHYLPSSENIR